METVSVVEVFVGSALRVRHHAEYVFAAVGNASDVL
jgi:hypothetical protein